ncbi:hypothetical protein NDU88_002541 [Pleurodeles waltl]|uniref:Uncharacterized protein n=1 Tax=Pleurodeles waltl TaxID=8319 RepID=A0AAV7MW35_PLEWA|nr:hypothetical protein NDU88_002541 [Pleurodeles waltl]
MPARGSKAEPTGVGAGAVARQDRTRGSGGAGECSETPTPGEDEDEKSEWGKGSGQPEGFKAATARKKMKKRIFGSGSPAHQIITKASKAIQWDYSSAPGLGGLVSLGGSLADTSQTYLEMIHQNIMEHQEETKAESCRTQLACRKMQGAIRLEAKTCTDFVIHIGEAGTRISKLEDDTAMQGEIREFLRSEMEDTQWKMADLENRSRQNNL